MHKFFVSSENRDNENIYILGQDRKHIKDVLRLNIGDEICVNVDEISYITKIKDIDSDKVTVVILKEIEHSNEPKVNITLYQGLAKGSKMDFIVQKCTEIGVKNFYGVEMERSVVKAKNDKWKQGKIDRYQKIIDEASKQSKRDFIPEFKGIISNKEMLENLKNQIVIVPYESEDEKSFKDILSSIGTDKINIVIGPEGGFDEEEIQNLEDIGANIISLGKRILRTETAGLVASTIVLYEYGDLGVN